MAGTAAKIAIVVGTYNRRDQIASLLDSIERHTRTAYEIHICDAGSTDGTVAWLAERATQDSRIKPVFEDHPRGQAVALNAVFRRLTTPWTCWLSDDNIVVSDGLDVAAAALAADPDLGMVGLKVRDLRGPFASAPYIGGITGIGVLNINQGMLPTQVLQALGGFSETFGDYGIDADLTTRVLLSGLTVAMTRTVCIHHNRYWAPAGTPEGDRIVARNDRYKALYMQIYAPRFGQAPIWMMRRAIWKGLRLIFPKRLALDASRPIARYWARDWHNMIAGRFISLRHELAKPESPIHLLQRCPADLVRQTEPARTVSA